ncbi:hypothetical protein chiPu_0019109 [Chiloscyllium punctatum]|uniref:Ig-like domain-containing protein n=1 Tax=Chiloscyllium punctatum TaxID=137246 RepID=A0A401RQQ1_CHIPU|nr:hypothetical protein [Chiloscyllium punctatum]
MPAGLLFSVFVLLLSPIFTERNLNDIYFLDGQGNISLKGPDNPGQGTFIWEWEPHSGQEKQQLITFQKKMNWWKAEWNEYYKNNNLDQWLEEDPDSIGLRLRNLAFNLAGLYTLLQTQPSKTTLKRYNIFGIKVESSAQYPDPREGSDVTLSCTISKLSDTVCLQWKQRNSSWQHEGKTDQIRVNDIVYLMVKHVTVEDEKLYMCEVQENRSIIHTEKVDFYVYQDLYGESYILYRSSIDHSELNLVCDYFYNYGRFHFKTAAWSWRSDSQNQEKSIVSASRHQPFNVERTHFGNRLVPTMARFNGLDFNVRIVPVLFEDAGVYTCSLGSFTMVTITLITVKVTAEPSDVETEEDSITLTCSVSDVSESIRLIWINNDGKIVEEKALTERNKEEKSLRLVIQKADKSRGKWTCVLFHQNMPQVSVPYYVEFRGK